MYAHKQLGLEPKIAAEIIKNNDLGGPFDARKVNDYLAVLTSHSEKLASIIKKVAETPRVEPIEECPVCGAETYRRRDRDGFLHAEYGWQCSEVVGHFVEWQFRYLKE